MTPGAPSLPAPRPQTGSCWLGIAWSKTLRRKMGVSGTVVVREPFSFLLPKGADDAATFLCSPNKNAALLYPLKYPAVPFAETSLSCASPIYPMATVLLCRPNSAPSQ